MNHFPHRRLTFYSFICSLLPFQLLGSQTNEGQLEMKIMGRLTHQPVPCRIHLKNSAGTPVLAAGLPAWRDHFVCAQKRNQAVVFVARKRSCVSPREGAGVRETDPELKNRAAENADYFLSKSMKPFETSTELSPTWTLSPTSHPCAP